MTSINSLKISAGICLLQLMLAGQSTAQSKAVTIKGEKISHKEIYINIDGDGLGYFIEKESALENVDKKTFSLTDNFVNVFFKWKNPLLYKLTWSDSVYADDQQDAVKNFTKRLFPLFNLPDPNAESNSQSLLAKSDAKAPAKGIVAPTANIEKPKSFKDASLTLLYIQLVSNQKTSLTNADIAAINKFTPLLKILDQGDVDLRSKVKESFVRLAGITDAEQVKEKVDQEKNSINTWNTDLVNATTSQKAVEAAAKDIILSDDYLNSYFHSTIESYIKKSEDLSQSNQTLVQLLSPIIDVLLKSAPPDDNIIAGQIKGYYRTRKLSFNEGEQMQTKLVLTQYKITDEKLGFEKASKDWKATLNFKSYDPFSVSVSTGLFYGSTSIRGFGTTPAGAGQMTVTDDTLKSNAAVTAVFCNLNFSVGSRFFSPLIQLGIDPTKKHPFFLAGGGFYIPVASFALSAGGIWTFEPELKTLKVGQTITSTTDLEKDVKHNFKLNPKGWYLGIQYNF